MTDTVAIPRTPTPAIVARLIKAARQAVVEIATADGALGHDGVERFFIEKLYAELVETCGGTRENDK